MLTFSCEFSDPAQTNGKCQPQNDAHETESMVSGAFLKALNPRVAFIFKLLYINKHQSKSNKRQKLHTSE